MGLAARLQEETDLTLPADYAKRQPGFTPIEWVPEVEGIVRAIERFVTERKSV